MRLGQFDWQSMVHLGGTRRRDELQMSLLYGPKSLKMQKASHVSPKRRPWKAERVVNARSRQHMLLKCAFWKSMASHEAKHEARKGTAKGRSFGEFQAP